MQRGSWSKEYLCSIESWLSMHVVVPVRCVMTGTTETDTVFLERRSLFLAVIPSSNYCSPLFLAQGAVFDKPNVHACPYNEKVHDIPIQRQKHAHSAC